MSTDTLFDLGFANIPALEELYLKYKEDPSSVDPSWHKIFTAFEATKDHPLHKKSPFPTIPLVPPHKLHGEEPSVKSLFQQAGKTFPADLRVYNLIEAYRTYGHLLAKFNPIATHEPKEPHELKLETLGFSPGELSVSFPTCGLLAQPNAPLLDIINTLKSIYCDKIGIEYMGLQRPELEHWLQQQIESTRMQINFPIEQKQLILQQLNKSELFESFLHTKYVGQKRFSLEGGETLIPMLAALIDRGAELTADEFVLGMPHRGRLNVLTNIMNKSYADIFSEFEEGYIPESFEGSGDVKYHKGFSSEILTSFGKKVQIDLTPNPSHLESVDPVVEGQVLARQIQKDDLDKEKVVPILIHGDAAVSGQGVVYETMQFYRLKGYSTGGTIHIVINNQIGFTTLPRDSRSTPYCTDIARAFGSPVFHVNAEDPESCVYVTLLAMEIRHLFHCDVFIDLNCYRKYGHNETDEPAYTQPLEYQMIRKRKPIREIYRDLLDHQGVLEKYMAEALEVEFKKALQQALKSAKIAPKETTEKSAVLPAPPKENGLFLPIQTGVSKEELQEVAQRVCRVPEGFNIHPKLGNLIKERLSMVMDDAEAKPVDWGMGETLAFGTLLWEGVHVRLSGQDSCRGTFSHRHALWMDQVAERAYYPLKHLKKDQGRFDVYNSPLSEYAVLGFEYGYSLAYPSALVIWEAQFGDFSNGAQITIDQYISTSEQKWGQKLGLVLFLPHGYEGQGPEHSSGRLERFLTLCGDDNLQIVNPTTPAQLFHMLRRQVLRPLRKPLIVFTPKGLLRHPGCVNKIDDFVKGSFQEILDDPHPPKNVKRIAFCTGRIYYDLIEERKKNNADDLAIIRIEQLYPFHTERMKEVIAKYSGVKEYFWVQEEPSNMGAWTFVRPIFRSLLPKGHELNYVGRTASASPATGSHVLHKKEYALFMGQLFKKGQPSLFEIASNYKA